MSRARDQPDIQINVIKEARMRKDWGDDGLR